MKFKIGDHVRVYKPVKSMAEFQDATGIVDKLFPEGRAPYHLSLDKPVNGWAQMLFKSQELEKIE